MFFIVCFGCLEFKSTTRRLLAILVFLAFKARPDEENSDYYRFDFWLLITSFKQLRLQHLSNSRDHLGRRDMDKTNMDKKLNKNQTLQPTLTAVLSGNIKKVKQKLARLSQMIFFRIVFFFFQLKFRVWFGFLFFSDIFKKWPDKRWEEHFMAIWLNTGFASWAQFHLFFMSKLNKRSCIHPSIKSF